MEIEQRVSFLVSYGPPVLRLIDGYWSYVYRKRRATGTIKKLLVVEGLPPTALIKVDGEGQYSGLLGKPMHQLSRL
jgi:hypothetical protein